MVDANMEKLNLRDNDLTSCTVSPGLTNLVELDLTGNLYLTFLTLPEDLRSLKELVLGGHDLTSLTLPEGLANLQRLNLNNNPLESLRVPQGMDIENLDLQGFPESKVTFY